MTPQVNNYNIEDYSECIFILTACHTLKNLN